MSEKILKVTTVLMVGDAVKDKSGSSRRWRPSLLSWGIAVLALGGMATALYPMTAAWLSSYNQSKVIESAALSLDALSPGKLEQLELARVYNEALAAGVKLEAGGNVPVGAGNLAGTDLKYAELLRASSDGLMARIRIPSIGVDLPVYHGTSDETLLRGAGHLEGSHLPVGGLGTRSVITAHRGLANSTMFTNLDQLRAGETFSVEVMGEVFTYQIFEVEVIEPTETSSLRAQTDKDLVTLITCTPLGVNSHRIVVTGERITPTPDKDIAAAGKPPMIPGFPWWGVVAGGGILLVTTYIVRRGFLDARSSQRGQ
ncbi:class C sortase [Leucobacter aridicollis]|uniref:class C sortase n=1 Tax=Leucobacter aridicollis TaxID=283878 RepID=UPI0037CCC26F